MLKRVALNVGKTFGLVSFVLITQIMPVAAQTTPPAPDPNIYKKLEAPFYENCSTSASDNTNTNDATVPAGFTLQQKIGQLLMVQVPDVGTAVNLEKQYQIGGFYSNASGSSLYSAKSSIDAVKKAGQIPALIGIDEEGGHVDRLGILPKTAKDMGQMSDTDIQNLAKKAGQKMTALGIDVDFAPVVDLDNGKNTAISAPDRSFSSSPNTVADKAGAFAKGLQAAGIIPTFKHFPGLGHAGDHGADTAGGNSDANPVIAPTLDTLKNRDLTPYESVLKVGGTSAVMVGNQQVPGLTNGAPASLSAPAYDLLRQSYNFNGLVFTDALPGYAGSLASSVTTSITAGANMPLINDPGAVANIINAVSQAVTNGQINISTIDNDIAAIMQLKNINNSSSTSTPNSTSSGCCDTSAGNGSVTVKGNDNIAKTINFFLDPKIGLSPAQAVGIAANFMWETGGGVQIDPTSGGSPSSGVFGIAQWTPGSKFTADKNYNHVRGADTDIAVQLQVVWDEMNGKSVTSWSGWASNLQAFKQINNPGQAADYFRANFEACDIKNASCTSDRVSTANHIFPQYSNGSVDGSTVSTSGGSCSSSSSTTGATGGFTNPFPGGWIPNRLDMGYDGTFKGQIVAPCDGVVTYSGPFNGWNGSSGVIIKCNSDIGFPVHSLYFTEGVGPITSLQGKQVTAGTPIANAVASPYGAYVGTSVGAIEWGVSQDGPIGSQVNTYADQIGFSGKCSPSAGSRAMVLKFYQWAQQTLKIPGNATDESCAGAS
jgi:beta-N-acetylhexosaminidase